MKKLLFTLIALCSIKAYAMGNNLQEEFIRAICYNNYEHVEQCINQGADVNEPAIDVQDATPLNCAAIRGNVEIAKLLITKSAKVNVENKNDSFIGSSALHYACENGHVEMVELLIGSGADLNKVNNYNHTPLHNAIAHKYLKIITVLLDAGAKANSPCSAENHGGEQWTKGPIGTIVSFFTTAQPGTLLGGAILLNNYDMVKLLVKKGAKVNTPSFFMGSPLAGAYALDNSKIIKLLEAHSAQVTEIDSFLLKVAIAENNKAGVKWLIQAGIFLEERRELRHLDLVGAPLCLAALIPLYQAICQGNKEIVELLLSAGANPHSKTSKGDSPLSLVTSQRNKLFVSLAQKWKNEGCLKDELDEVFGPGPRWQTEMICWYQEIIDLLEDYQNNPVPLKYQCANQIRKLVKQGKLSKEDLNKLDEFGFDRLIVPAENKKKDTSNNNNN